jgi:hypothetical protein
MSARRVLSRLLFATERDVEMRNVCRSKEEQEVGREGKASPTQTRPLEEDKL